MADEQQLWRYPEVAAHVGISVRATRSRKSRGHSGGARRHQGAGPALEARHVAGLAAGRPRVPQRPARHRLSRRHRIRLTVSRSRP